MGESHEHTLRYLRAAFADLEHALTTGEEGTTLVDMISAECEELQNRRDAIDEECARLAERWERRGINRGEWQRAVARLRTEAAAANGCLRRFSYARGELVIVWRDSVTTA